MNFGAAGHAKGDIYVSPGPGGQPTQDWGQVRVEHVLCPLRALYSRPACPSWEPNPSPG